MLKGGKLGCLFQGDRAAFERTVPRLILNRLPSVAAKGKLIVVFVRPFMFFAALLPCAKREGVDEPAI
jgi:hypothetical protein